MQRIIASLLARLKRSDRTPALVPMSQPSRKQRSSRETARALAHAIDDATARGLWQHADRVANTAMRIAADHPMLCERIARLRLAQGEAQTALDVVDACFVHSSSLRLLRAVCLLQLGRMIEAQLDLREWASKASAPLQARLLLALLEWRAGDMDAACRTLLLNLKQIEDPSTLIALTMINAAQENTEQASWWADRLQTACAWSATERGGLHLNAMLHSVNLVSMQNATAEPTSACIQTLAMELLAHEDTIPALIEAQRLALQPDAARLLLKAIQHIASELDDRAAGYVAIVQLLIILGESADAVEWARRGLVECPMSVSLLRMLREMENNSTAHDGVLAKISDGHDLWVQEQEQAA